MTFLSRTQMGAERVMSPTIPQACCWFTVVMTMVMPLRVAGFSRPDDCAVLPRAQMRVRLTLGARCQ